MLSSTKTKLKGLSLLTLILLSALLSTCNGDDPVAVTGVSVLPTSLALTVGGSTSTLRATVSPTNANNKNVSWTSSNSSVATVSSAGVVTPRTAGTATITVTTEDGGKTATCAVTVTTVAVTGVSVHPTSLALTVGGSTSTLTATIEPGNASNKNISWTSSHEAVATVSNAGVVTPRTAGETTITVTTTDGNNTATCAVTVTTVAVTRVSVLPTSLTLTAGGSTSTLRATIEPSNASNKNISWASSHEAVATVSNAGVVTPLTEGETTITVTTEDGNKTATCAITVTTTVAVTRVSVLPTSLTLTAGGSTSTLTATVYPNNATDKTVSWTSSNPTVATVSSAGVVTPRTAGRTTITVTTTDGSKTATCAVTVTAATVAVTRVSVLPTSLTLTAGGSTSTLTATVYPSNATNKTVSWTSSNPTVATVSSAGVVTPRTAGETTITVTTTDGSKTATCAVTVTAAATVAVTGVSVRPGLLKLAVGKNFTLTAIIEPSNATNKNVSWASFHENFATVSSSGRITARSVGATIISVTTEDGNKPNLCNLTVTAANTISVTEVTLNKSTLTLVAGGTISFITATVKPSTATDKTVFWYSSNNNVATAEGGMITSVAPGTATITAASYDGYKTATCTITVTR